MFVAFGLTISLDSFDVNKVLELIESSETYDIYMNNFTLLKKIGKAVLVSNVTREEMETSLKSLIVEWD